MTRSILMGSSSMLLAVLMGCGHKPPTPMPSSASNQAQETGRVQLELPKNQWACPYQAARMMAKKKSVRALRYDIPWTEIEKVIGKPPSWVTVTLNERDHLAQIHITPPQPGNFIFKTEDLQTLLNYCRKGGPEEVRPYAYKADNEDTKTTIVISNNDAVDLAEMWSGYKENPPALDHYSTPVLDGHDDQHKRKDADTKHDDYEKNGSVFKRRGQETRTDVHFVFLEFSNCCPNSFK